MKRTVLSLLAAGVLATASPALAQQLPYTATIDASGATPYTELLPTQGNVITTADFDDALSAPIPLGFTFSYNDSTFTDFQLSTNGFIKLGTTPVNPAIFQATGTGNGNSIFRRAAAETDIRDIIAGFNTDLMGTTTTEYRYHLTGVAPNRVGIIQFKDVADKPIGSHPTIFSNLSFQIWLYEATGNIEIVAGPFTSSGNAPSSTPWRTFSVGLRSYKGGALRLYRGSKQSTQSWDLTAFGTSASSPPDDVNTRNTNMPPNGLKYTFTYTGIIGSNKGSSSQALRLFPNPASQAVTVPTAGRLTLFDAQGRQLLDQAVEAGQPVNIRHLPAGLYQVRLAAANGTLQMGRLVKE